jgi:hypothetical protein
MTRFAVATDLAAVVQLLLAFGREARVGFRAAETQDVRRVTELVAAWIRSHYVRIAEVNGDIIGVLIAERAADFWDPSRTVLQERAWYVRPEHRGSRASARLWQAWQADSDAYLADHRIDLAVMSTQGSATPFDPARRGWRMVEQTWLKEAAWQHS